MSFYLSLSRSRRLASIQNAAGHPFRRRKAPSDRLDPPHTHTHTRSLTFGLASKQERISISYSSCRLWCHNLSGCSEPGTLVSENAQMLLQGAPPHETNHSRLVKGKEAVKCTQSNLRVQDSTWRATVRGCSKGQLGIILISTTATCSCGG